MRRALTVRQTQVIRLIAEGLINKEIADRIGIGMKTVEKHVRCLLRRLPARTRANAVYVWMKRLQKAKLRR